MHTRSTGLDQPRCERNETRQLEFGFGVPAASQCCTARWQQPIGTDHGIAATVPNYHVFAEFVESVTVHARIRAIQESTELIGENRVPQ